ELGLIAYGHREKGDCADIELLIPMGSVDVTAVAGAVDALNPTGMTPITASVNAAFDAVRERPDPATIIVVTDGLETCGGDPCQAVKDARAAGLNFVMHVVGFDVPDQDVSQLQCAAQAGNGRYFDAETADQLAGALDMAVEMPADAPAGYVWVRATADGKLVDVAVRVRDSQTGEESGGSRTYDSPDTNPTVIPLPGGTYSLSITAVGLRGDRTRRIDDVKVGVGDTVRHEVDFSEGELAVGVTRNGALSDATVRVYETGTKNQVASGRTYTSDSSNPKTIRISSGVYDIEISSVEIDGGADTTLTGVEVMGSQRTERSHEFKSGALLVGTKLGDALVDSVVRIAEPSTGTRVDQSRTYTSDTSNPSRFVLPPGTYRITAKPVRPRGLGEQSREVTIATGAEVRVDFSFEQ
ncbi:MAG: VWA domain-containing protein, partial [Rhodothermia bacterium]|nr:VWA domain-containing protein [Rhodothermia bacterium]